MGRRERFGTRLVAVVAMLYGICFVVWRLLVSSPLYARWWPLQVSEIFWVWAFVPLPFLMVAGVVLRSRWLWVGILVPLLWFSGEYASLFLPPASAVAQATVSGATIRVMTFNTWNKYKRDGEFAAAVRQWQPDVIALQEINPRFGSDLKDLVDEWPYQLRAEWGTRANIAFLSKFPILSVETERDWQGCDCMDAVVSWHDQAIRVIVVDMRSPRYDINLRGVVPHIDGFNAESQVLSFGALMRRIETRNKPLIVLGDFNTTERQEGYYELYAAGLEDAHAAAGWGLGFTYPAPYSRIGWLPVSLIRIDHIFYGAAWQANQVWTTPLMGSDHQTVIADLRLVAQE